MTTLIHPTYLPNIAHMVAIVKAKTLVFEVDDNFQKQTYRNRCVIYGANGILPLSIPVIYSQKNRQKYRDIKIYNNEKWQLKHWKSIESAYRTSPFFEFYEDEFHELFTTKTNYLLDYNFLCLQCIFNCLQLENPFSKTTTYEKHPTKTIDFRPLVQAKNEKNRVFAHYKQLFENKHGYISNLSVLDLICNQGPNALFYLETQELL